MQTKIFKLLLIAIVCLCTNLNAQVKTKVFYTDIPNQYKTMLKEVSKIYKIEAPTSFYELKEKALKVKDEDIQFKKQYLLAGFYDMPCKKLPVCGIAGVKQMK